MRVAPIPRMPLQGMVQFRCRLLQHSLADADGNVDIGADDDDNVDDCGRTNFTFCSLKLSFRSNGSFDGGNSNGADTADGGFTFRTVFECCFGAVLDCASTDSAFRDSSFSFSESSFRSNDSIDAGIANGSGTNANENDDGDGG